MIAGLGEAEALHRAQAYVEAGADMILIHSKKKDPSEIEGFLRIWSGSMPLVIVPNAYPHLDAERVKALRNVRMMIYGTTAFALPPLPCRRPSAESLPTAASRTSTRTFCQWRRSSESRRWTRSK
ncbi:isocitrate lyase/phosphoenolpyruvate mutase family protein [Bradyrhizobium oropedii]|uniref:isocitrate lyase/phosphoenolpyruvate mutase family protein n=1 Tax=Bradyrhizobium oropedii TaxID=1571201 RepID=UPI001E57D86A|nr:isocitrate lyase/phosphoenolpyruvate mutase family protein [Bradyrhizobium oropedii]